MKTHSIVTLLVLILAAAPAMAEVAVRVGVGFQSGPEFHERWDRRPYRRHPRVHRVVAPVVVTPAPYYAGYAYPVYAPPPAPPQSALNTSGDYAADLAELNGKLRRLRGVVHRQYENETFTEDQHRRFTAALENIEQDEHARAFDRGGNLSDADLADLFSRLDQIGVEIETALAQ